MNSSTIHSFITYKHLAYACALLLLLRLAFVILTYHKIHSAEDYLIAFNLVSGLGYTFDTAVGATALKAPVYPLFLAGCIAVFGASAHIAAALLQHCALGLVPLLLARLGRLWDKELLGLLAGFAFILHPTYFYYPNVLEVTNLFIPLFLIWGMQSTRLWQETTRNGAVLWGVLSGIVILTQPLSLPFVIGVLCALLGRRKLVALSLGILSCAVVFAPWVTRNYLVFHKFIPTKSAFWMNFYVGWQPQYHQRSEFNLLPEHTQRSIDSLERTINDVEMESYYRSATLAVWRQHPGAVVQKCLYQAGVYWWVPVRYQDDTSMEFLAIRKIPVIVLTLLWSAGMVVLFRTHRRLAWLTLASLGYFTVVYGLTHTANIRFKLDIEWIELFAVAALAEYVFFRGNGLTQQKDTAL